MDFVIIANDWRAGVDNPTSKHRIAIELAKRGHRVLWVQGSGMRQPALTSSTDRSRIINKLKQMVKPPAAAAETSGHKTGVSVLTPPAIPLPAKAWARKLNGFLCRNIAIYWARKAGFHKPVLINYVPIQAEAMASWPWQRVYHCVDRWDAFTTYDAALMTEMDARSCRYADVVIASSGDLAERCERHNRQVRLVMHGVDYGHFATSLDAPRPADLPPGKIVGFFGLVSEWLDQELIVKTARAVPDAQVVLIGRPDVKTDALEGIPNLHLLGPRPFRELPAYLRHFEVGIIPFVINDLTRAVNPIKLREMLAGGCPVVSTALPEVSRIANSSSAVDVAHTHDEFIRYVQARLASAPTEDQRRSISQSMAGETWSAKVDEILGAIGAK
jgi:glycosyltransferase involved in cell wall biosynthesis